MGKPSSSCLKIIACGRETPVDDDIQTSETKGSADKRGWSFRKRSARHRVLSNNVTTESLTLADKEVPQSTSIPIQASAHPPVPEKVVALEQTDEKQPPPSLDEVKPAKFIEPELSEILEPAKQSVPVQPIVSETLYTPELQEPVEPKVSEAVNASKSPELGEQKTYDTMLASKAIATMAVESVVPVESKTSKQVVPSESPATVELKLSEIEVASQADVLEEPKVLDMQTDVRGLSAQTELVKQKSIVKVQAAIRGHLVRRQAVDTLYCIQGIVKVQNLVKARHSNPSADEVLASQSSIEKLLKNAFARQLLKSTPKSKSTVMKCDPLTPSPSRLWLERWMDLYSYGLANLEKPQIMTEDGQSQLGRFAPKVESENLLKVISNSINPECAVKEGSITLENGKSSNNPYPVEERQSPKLFSNKEKMEQSCENNDTSFEGPLEMAEQKNESIHSGSHLQTQSVSLSDLPVETEDLSTKSMPSKQVEVESKKLAFVTRKSSNPSFVAAQSKFEELSSTPNYSGSLGSNYQLSTAEYHLDNSSSRESEIKETEPSGSDSLVPFEIRANMGGSENGTELSVTSALDSPYLSEAETAEVDLEVKIVEERSSNLVSIEGLEVETKGSSTVHESKSSSASILQDFYQPSKPVVAADSHQPKQELEPVASAEHDSSVYAGLEMAVDSLQVEQKLERTASDLLVDSISQTEKLAHNSSPRASPNNSSHRTPSSQVSGKVKKSKVDKRTPAKPLDDSGARSTGKRTPAKPLDDSGVKSSGKRTPTKPLDDSGVKSSGKRTPNKPLDDSGVRSSAEHPSKDHKSERRRNSFGSAKSDNADQEPRDSTSSTKTIPSYMQATKSARAKVNSPRSSPDVQDSDAYMIKKRHSLPGAGGRQGSPRVERPASQAPQSQTLKGNANTPPQERKWIRMSCNQRPKSLDSSPMIEDKEKVSVLDGWHILTLVPPSVCGCRVYIDCSVYRICICLLLCLQERYEKLSCTLLVILFWMLHIPVEVCASWAALVLY
ncbi:hypothetical protein V2J09_019839 [Rumex salicifolius]